MTFVSYFANSLKDKIRDENKKNIREADVEKMAYEEEGADIDDSLIRAMDEAMLKKQGYKENDSGLLREEQFESICDLLYDMLQVIINQKRTKAEIFKLYYTDTIMNAFSKYSVKGNKEFRHEKQIFENMERELVDYIFVNAIKYIRDIVTLTNIIPTCIMCII